MLLLASLATVATLLSPVGTPSDTTLGANQSVACGAEPTAAPSVANALRAAVAVHGGAVRWDLRRGAIRLWVQRRPAIAADVSVLGSDWRRAIAVAADAWSDVVPGLAFVIESDSSHADVIVTWERDLQSAAADGDFAFLTAGRTALVPGADGRALAAHVRLAIFAPDGARYSVDDVRAVARHELGHALGLAHHAAPTSVMAPLVRAERLSDDDRATLRALYALPVGARCSLPAQTLGG
ncbi:MAG: matrixin family metalloprotease [Gemmatimonadetes bacterium]|nr:matrixin family metalloprotease [Gemmatimonadota bacterium]